MCGNKKGVPQEALEARVKHVLDAMAKDPAKLEALVSEHNGRVRDFNEQHMATVRRLETQLVTVNAALVNVVSAIEKGAGSIDSLVVVALKHDNDAKALKAQISEAEGQVQPLLFPRPLAVADFLSESASVFTGEYVADKAFIESVLEKIVVHMDGTIVLHFRRDSLFGPLAQYAIQPERPRHQAAPTDRADLVTDGTVVQFKAPLSSGNELQDIRRAVNYVESLADLCAPEAGNFERRRVDFGGGVVAVYNYPRPNTFCVPSEI